MRRYITENIFLTKHENGKIRDRLTKHKMRKIDRSVFNWLGYRCITTLHTTENMAWSEEFLSSCCWEKEKKTLYRTSSRLDSKWLPSK